MRPLIITGGGTGGHLFPMVAIAEALEARGVDRSQLRFVGSTRGQDRLLLSTQGIDLTLLPGRGLRRSWTAGALWDNLRAVLSLAAAQVRALWLVGRWRPAVVVSVGGYASAAVSVAAVLCGVPVVLVELDAVPSAAQRLVSRRARARCVPFAVGDPRAVVTGVPIRSSLAALPRDLETRQSAAARLTPPLDPQRRVVVVMTGSLGSARVNRAVSELARLWAGRADLAIIHVTGRRDAAWVREAAPPGGDLDYRVMDFADMVELWSVADVAVCRAGAMTVAELTALGIPAILVPLPGAPGDHQGRNAARLDEAGAAIVVRDEDCDGPTLARSLEELLQPSRLAAAGEAARRLGRRDGASRIAEVVEGVAR